MKNVEDIYPLSPLQQGLLFHALLDPESPAYLNQSSFTLTRVAPQLFRRTWEIAVSRHAVLRTAFLWEGLKEPLQAVRQRVRLPWEEEDWRGVPADQRRRRLDALRAAERRRPLAPAKAPLMRFVLLRMEDDVYELLWTYHHLLLDGWSTPLLFQEVMAVYRALCDGRQADLPPVRPYRDYIAWLQRRGADSSEAFWRGYLAGVTAPTPLGFDRPGTASALSSAEVSAGLPVEQAAALQALAARHRLTLYTLAQGAWALVLARYSGEEDVVFGSVVAGRPADLPGVESMIGLFINTLPVRVRVHAGAPALAWLGELQKQQLEVRQHEQSPLPQIQGWSGLQRGAALFDSILSCENYPQDAAPGPAGQAGLRVARVRNVEQTGYALSATVAPQEGLTVAIAFDPSRFDASSVKRRVAHLCNLLAGLAAAPESRAEDLPLLSAAERQQLLLEWSDTEEPVAEEARTFPLSFAAQVRRRPEAIAAACAGECLSYGELDARAERWARALAGRGVGAETLVALLAERGLPLLTAILAVLKAGGAYLPLDSRHPTARQRLVLARSGAALVLAQERLRADARCWPQDGEAARGLPPLLELEDLEEGATTGCASRCAPRHLAYVIFTSGSTGVPKGAMVEHRGMLNHLRAKVADLGLGAADVVAQSASQCFDVSVWQLLAALMVGGRVEVALDGDAQDPERLLALVEREGVTVLETVPSLLRGLLEVIEVSEAPPPLACLRWLLVTGEAFPVELARRWLAWYPAVKLLNAYGPTECSDDVTHFALRRAPDGGGPHVAIGRPLANFRLDVLDRRRQLMPLGGAGELCVGGVGVGRGYVGEPARTAEVFVPDPHGALRGEPGARLYRTGDLVRRSPEGVLEFLGRLDQQVKVRGYRIELGEVEAALELHPGVRAAVALAREHVPGQASLVAYVVPSAAPLAAEALRAHLRLHLPEHMVPAALVNLAELPLLPSGKVDRKALPAPELEADEQAYVAPRNPAEETLARIWAEVLRRERVGVQENFFDLGGDSILSIQILSRASRAGLRLTARQVFEHPTIAELAAVARQVTLTPGEAGPVTGPVPLTPIQQWFFEQRLAHSHHFNQAVLLEVVPEGGGRVEPALLHRTAGHLLAHHDALRMRFEPPVASRPLWRQVASGVGEASSISIDLSALPEERWQPALQSAAATLQGSLNLETGPLLRVALFAYGAARPDLMLIVVHHLAMDGVSWRILLEDFEAVYRQAARWQVPELPPKTTSYQRWAEQLTGHARSADVQTQASWWLARLRRPLPRLPVDSEEGANLAGSARDVTVTLGPEETHALLREVPRGYRTQIQEVLLTALTEAFARWTGCRRQLIHLEGHGREDIFEGVDVSRTVGWFTTIFPVLLDLEEVTAPGEALKSIKEQMRAVPDRGIGYGLLRYLEGGQVEKSLRALPQPEVLFNYLGQLDAVVAEEQGFFRPARGSAGEASHGQQIRPHLLDVNGSIAGGRLRMVWTYSENRHRRATIETLAGSFIGVLRGLIAHCLAEVERGAENFSPSDFPLARIDQATLDRVTAAESKIEDLYPAAPVQQGMLFHSLRSPGSGVYVEQLSLVLGGDLDVEAFRGAWQQLVDRHPALRTAFFWKDLETPLQRVHREVTLAWECKDWSEIPALERRERLASFLDEDRRIGLDLERAPLMHFTLILMEAHRYHFLWTFHHVLLDGWSMPILLRELFTFYEAGRQGGAARLEPVRPYRSYIAWLARQDLAAAEAFWRRSLAGFVTPTPLGIGRLLPDVPARRDVTGVQEHRLSVPATEALRTLARRQQLTFNTFVQGAWAFLLSRYSGEEDVTFGAVTSGRSAPLAGIEETVGLFINTLPARVRISPAADWLDWLRELQEQQLEMRQYEYSPLYQVQGWSEVPRNLSMFESILAFENYPVDESVQRRAGKGLGVERADLLEQTNYPITFAAIADTRLNLRVLYEAARFESPAITRMLRHVETVLMGMLSHPAGAPLSTLPLLAAEERHQLLREWNATRTSETEELVFKDLFAAQVARTPQAIAVACGDEALTYGELDRRAGRLAGLLRGLGVGPEVVVALLADRSPVWLTAVLAVYKAGGAYLPLDPLHPRSRQSQLVLRSGAALVLAESGRVADLHRALDEAEAVERPPILSLEIPLQPSPGEHLSWGCAPSNLAYVIYTSGSTGVPKGAMVEHRGMLNHLLAKIDDLELGSTDRVAQTASQCFDISVWQFLAVLMVGGEVHIAADEITHDPEELLSFLIREGITVLEVVPSLLEGMLDVLSGSESTPCDPSSLRWLIVTGESCLPETCRRSRAAFPAVQMLNAYGPTECSDDVTHQVIRGAAAVPWHHVPIGRAILNSRIHILDSWGGTVPAEVPGELFAGGIGLGRGYLGESARTAEAFVPDPLAGLYGEPGARLYRTGDLARFGPDGALEFLGRRDHQVKIRGFRIELGEIDARLAEHPAVQSAVAVVRQDRPGEPYLAAYVVFRETLPEPSGELCRFLAERLPDYMVPAVLVSLEALPLTSNGKVDRKSLPAPDRGSGEVKRAPRSQMEDLLALIFSEVLHVEQVSTDDNFFALGGHSLLATRLASRASRVLGTELPLRAVFEAPTVRALAERAELAIRTGKAAQIPPIEKIRRDQDLPLSFAQQRLWFLDQMEPGSTAYTIPSAVRLFGPLDAAAFAKSLTEIVRRHEVLRTSFPATAGEPRQVIAPAGPFSLALIDLRLLPAEGRWAEALRLLRAEALRSFDLAVGPLLRSSLLQLEPEMNVVFLAMHHIVSDGASMGLFMRELKILYTAFTQGRSSPLAELEIQYADYASWQRRWLSGETLQAELAHWRERLQGAPPLLSLPTDRPRPALQSFAGAGLESTLPEDLSRELRTFCQRQGVTVFMALLATLQALLGRSCGQTDVVVGTPIAGRSHLQTEPLIGLFINTLALRTDLSKDPDFTELMGRVREVTLSSYAHQELPFEKLVEELAPQRNLGHTPLFQVMLNMLNFGDEPDRSPGLKMEPIALGEPGAKLDLAVDVIENRLSIGMHWVYSTHLFDATRIARMAGHFGNLLRAGLQEPRRSISDLPLLDPAERQQLVVEWNDTSFPWTGAGCLHDLVAAQAVHSPDRIAIVSGGEEITYRELDRRAGCLARHLRRLGVGPEVGVALLVERSPDMVIAALGVLKAGGAYVPLDPELPTARLAYILADCGAGVAITQDRLRDRLDGCAVRVVVLDGEELWQGGRSLTETAVEPDALAYVVYTSGTTGQPKGVLSTHRGAVSYLSFLRATYGLNRDDRVLQLPSLAFDASVRDLFGPLSTGSTVVLVTPEEAKDPAALLQSIERRRISRLLSVVPTMLRALLAEAASAGVVPGFLRQILVSGERLYLADCSRARQVFGEELEIINQYGPTECTMTSSYHRASEVDEGGVEVLIGRPISNRHFYLLDGNLMPVPLGAVGQLYIGGTGLARGYLRRPGLTVDRFIPDLFGSLPGGRLYATGDLVRYLPTGDLEFLGRADLQVKLRGFRVEPEEIEAALRAFAGVRQVAVVLQDDGQGGGSLMAWVVAESGVTLDPGELRRFLDGKLPAYMVPARFVILHTLPVTTTGKVDRKALSQSIPPVEEAATGPAVPPTPIEELLVGIFAEVLGREQVGNEDNFFALGGHSLLVTQVISRVRAALSVEVPLRTLFEHPDVAGLAKQVQRAMLAPGRIQAPPISPAPRDRKLPLSFAQQRLWFLSELEPRSVAYNMPLSIRLTGPLDVAALQAAFAETLRRHEVLRTTFEADAGEPWQRVADRVFHLPLVSLAHLSETVRRRELQRLAGEEARCPFDLARGPLLRATLIIVKERQEHRALVTMHHIASDAWSMGLLVQELAALYSACCERRPSPLPALPIQYADFACWQRRWLTGEVLAVEVSYWREKLAGMPPALDLPCDRPRPPVQTFGGESFWFLLPSRLSARLEALSRRRAATLFMTLLATFQALLTRYTGQEDVSVGTAIAGRNRLEIEPLIGFFVNTLVLRVDLSGEPTFAQLLERVRAVALAAYAHQDLPFEKLVEELHPQRDLARTPLFQVLFELHNAANAANAAPQQPRMPDLGMEPLPVDSGAVKFDLTVIAAGGGDSLRLEMQYNRDLFDGSTVRRLAGHFHHLLEGVSGDPDGAVASLPILAPGERHQLLAEWNAAASFAVPLCLHELFAAQAAARPAAVAAVCSGDSLTYGELERRANELAHRLRSLGVGPEVPVGLCLERSLDMVVAVVGVLKAGGAYVPLDPLYPRERLALSLADAQPPVVLTQERLRDALPETAARILCLDAPHEALEDEGTEAVAGAGPDNLAYIIFTSGSTGRPKGSLITHRNAVRLFAATGAWFGFGADDVWTLFHSYAFDFSVWELWGALLYGGRLVVVPYWVSRSPADLQVLLVSEGVTVLNQTPSAFRQLVLAEEEAPTAIGRLRTVIFGGEALDLTALAPWIARHGDRKPRLINMYGITETTVHVSYRPISRDDLRDAWRSPIGVPIPDLRVHILDRYGNLAPVGVAGELYVGGPGLGRGYLGQPALTAERFVADPFCGAGAGGRLYKTGDLARYSARGGLDYLGRIDHQVKIRGFRIELGEIEAALMRDRAVHEALVLLREEAPDDRRLVAYVVLRPEAARDTASLRTGLLTTLPDYMVPAAFVLLASLPLNDSGKVDRRALLAIRPDGEVAGPEVRREPRGPIAELLGDIFADVLRRDEVDPAGDFFEMGGHSLLAIQLVARIRETFRVELPLRSLFEHPKLAELAEAIALGRDSDAATPVALIERAPRGGWLPLSLAQQRLWSMSCKEPDGRERLKPMAFRITGSLDEEALAATLSEIVCRHEILRTAFLVVEGQPVGEIAPPGVISLPKIDLAGLSDVARWAEAQRLMREEERRPFDLSRPPLLRSALVRLAPEDRVVLLTFHRIAVDGWSMGILIREVRALYEAFSQARPSPLPELEMQYADFAFWQRRWLNDELVEAELAYWRGQLGSSTEPLRLPTDHPSPAIPWRRGGRCRWEVPADLLLKLKGLARRQGATLFMTLLAAYQTVLSRHADQEEVSVGTPIAGRSHVQVENLVGPFANTLVLRTTLAGDPSFTELLVRVREVALAAYAHQGVPFEKLVEELDPDPDPSRTPLFQVSFSLTPREGDLELPDLRVGLLPGENPDPATFALAMPLVEESGRLGGSLIYRSDLFERVTIERMRSHLESFLIAISESPERSLSELSMLTAAERHLLLVEQPECRPAPYCGIRGLLAGELGEPIAGPEILATPPQRGG